MFDLDYDTKYITVIIEFKYDSKDKRSKYTPNNVREAFLGKDKGSPKVPAKMKEIFKKERDYDRDLLFPVHFSLIKKPVKAELPGKNKPFTIRNTAVGAIILYEYLGLQKDFKKFCEKFDLFLNKMMKEKKPQYFEFILDIKLIIGYDLKDVTEG